MSEQEKTTIEQFAKFYDKLTTKQQEGIYLVAQGMVLANELVAHQENVRRIACGFAPEAPAERQEGTE